MPASVALGNLVGAADRTTDADDLARVTECLAQAIDDISSTDLNGASARPIALPPAACVNC
jgi:hypothetical protein